MDMTALAQITAEQLKEMNLTGWMLFEHQASRAILKGKIERASVDTHEHPRLWLHFQIDGQPEPTHVPFIIFGAWKVEIFDKKVIFLTKESDAYRVLGYEPPKGVMYTLVKA